MKAGIIGASLPPSCMNLPPKTQLSISRGSKSQGTPPPLSTVFLLCFLFLALDLYQLFTERAASFQQNKVGSAEDPLAGLAA